MLPKKLNVFLSIIPSLVNLFRTFDSALVQFFGFVLDLRM